ncbi:hypothetical protein M2318_004844 [Metapseudomonas resinovorans]|uniref:hypothetical protein n=1 Tax=Metapseudomonas resinovorans TaxID=53412 RepID=UPI003D1CAD23
MSEMAAKGVVTIGEGEGRRDIVVSELTPAQMRQVILANPWPGETGEPEAYAGYQIDSHLFADCRLTDLAIFTGLKVSDFDDVPPSQLRKVLDKAKELNPDFFGAMARMAEARPKS